MVLWGAADIDFISDKALSESILDRLDPLEMKG